MSELLQKLGIDWKLLLAQIVNFLILLWVLKRYAYRPILRALSERSKKIAKSMDDAKKIEVELEVLAQERERVMAEARKEAQSLLEGARQDAAALLARTKEEAKAEATAVTQAAEHEVRRMKENIVNEAKGELADLLVRSTEKIVRVKLDSTSDAKLIDEALKRD